MKKLFDTTLKKISIVLILTIATFLTFDKNFFNEYLVFSSKAATGYHYVYPVDGCSVIKTSDQFGEIKNDAISSTVRLNSSSGKIPVYAFTSGAVEKIQKTEEGSLWLAGQDGFNFLYKDIEEITVSESSVKAGDLIGYSNDGLVDFGMTRNGYGEKITGNRSKEEVMLNKEVSIPGVITNKYVQEKIEFFNVRPVIESDLVVRQCGENANPKVNLINSVVTKNKDGSNKVTLKARIEDPKAKGLKASFRLRKIQEGQDNIVLTSGDEKNTWSPGSIIWAKSGTEREYSFDNVPAGTYEWSARVRNTEGVYSKGITFGTEGSEARTVSMVKSAFAETLAPSEGWAPAQGVSVEGTTNQIVYSTNFVDTENPNGLKVGSDDPSRCCYAVLADANPVPIAPNSGKYVLRISVSLASSQANNNRLLTIYDGIDRNTKQNIWEGPILYGTSGSEGIYSFLIDTAKDPFNKGNMNLRFRIANESAINITDYTATTFYIKNFEIERIIDQVPSTTTTATVSTTTAPTTKPSGQKVITLDPGHPSEVGSGATGEIALNWSVAGRLRSKLASMGYKVVMTKTSEGETVTNKRRAEIANQNESDLFFRIHADDSSTSRGYFFMTPDRTSSSTGLPTSESRQKGSQAASAIASAIQSANLGLPRSSNPFRSDASGGNQRSDPKCPGLLVASCYSQVPTTLIEMGELKTADKDWLTNATNQDKLATAMANGISSFLGGSTITTTTKPASAPACSFTQSSYTLSGTTASLAYSTQNATSAQLCSAAGNCKTANVGQNQTVTASPNLAYQNTSYYLEVSNGSQKATCNTVVINPNPQTTTTTRPPATCGFDTARLSNYNNCNGGTVSLNTVLSPTAKNYAISIGVPAADIRIWTRSETENAIREEISKQWPGVSNKYGATQADAQRAILAYAEHEGGFAKFRRNSNGEIVPINDSTTFSPLSITNDKYSGCKNKQYAAAWDMRYAIHLGVKENIAAFVNNSSGTGLERWKRAIGYVFLPACPNCYWSNSCPARPDLQTICRYTASISAWNTYANESAYSCSGTTPPPVINNAPNTPSITDVVTTSDIVVVPGVGGNVTLKAIASDPDKDQVSVKFRIYKYDAPGKTPAEYCSTMKESPFDEFKPSGDLHTFTFTNLAPGTYKWSAMANDEHYRKSEGGSMFCYSSNDPTRELYGFAMPRTFNIEVTGPIDHRPYIKTAEMLSNPNAGGTSVALNVKGYDDDGDQVRAFYRVREKIVGNCVVGSGISSYYDSGWTTLKQNGSEFPVTVSGLKPGTIYQWSVKLEDQDGTTSLATPSGLSFCGGTEWYSALEFSTPVAAQPSCEFTQVDYPFVIGSPVTLAYSTKNANSAEICSAGGTCKAVSTGTGVNFSANPTAATTYTLKVKDIYGNNGFCTTKVTPSATTTTGSTTTTSTKPGTSYTRIQTWDYCKDSTLAADCPAIFTNSGAVPFFDPGALDSAHKLNAFFLDLAAVGSIGAVPSETAFISLDPGTYQFRVRAATDNKNQNIRLSAENASGTFVSKENVSLDGGSGSAYGTYTLEFTLAQKDTVRLRIRKNDTQATRIMIDRYDVYKAQ